MLIVMQGWPGSGKSTIAVELMKRLKAKICSTDDFHLEGLFDFENLSYYHALNQWEAEFYLSQGENVIIDNTNIRQIHVQPYINAAKRYNHEIQIIRAGGNFESVHNVPKAVVERMKKEMETLVI